MCVETYVILINVKLPYGGPGGIRTPVQNTFLSASYSNQVFIIQNVKTVVNQFFYLLYESD
jgi:hypothetical protein